MDERGLLKAKFIVFNLTGVALASVGYANGWFVRLTTGHIALAASVIVAVFLIGLVMTAYRVWKVGEEMDRFRRGEGRVMTIESERALELRLFSRISHIQHVANALALLGLIGTAWGFSLFAAEITPDKVGNASAAGLLVSTIASGIGVAIYATMLGGILCLWTTCNLQLLRGATASLCALILDEAKVRSRGTAYAGQHPRAVVLAEGAVP
jgi:hypothetical protein